MTGKDSHERITWLRYEFEQVLEGLMHGNFNTEQIAARASELTTYAEMDRLQDELLQHTFWALQHVAHQPACWAPKREEIEYLMLCLRDEESFNPEQVEFTYQRPDSIAEDC